MTKNPNKTPTERMMVPALVLIVAVLICILWNGCNRKEELTDMFNAVNDTLRITRNDLNQEIAETNIIVGNFKDFKNLNASKDSTIAKLQGIVDKSTTSASVLNNSTGRVLIRQTDTLYAKDTVRIDSLIYIFPEYRISFKNKWEDFSIAASRDSFDIKYKVFNEFHIEQFDKKQGFLKPKIPTISVTNINPNTETLEMKTFTVATPKQKKGLWVGIGAGALLIMKAIFEGFKK